MRPAGDVRLALLCAAHELTQPGRGPTLEELARKACVGQGAARRTVDNLCRAGELRIARRRVVSYRNRPVAEYEVAAPDVADIVPLGQLLAAWGR